MYRTTMHEADISVEEYLEKYVNEEMFLEACKGCENYNMIWSCPGYDFEVAAYWRRFRNLHLCAFKIEFDAGLVSEVETEDELQMVLQEVLPKEKAELARRTLRMEKEQPGSVCLSAGGGCQICKEGCSRPAGEPCRHPELMRYSLEALGGNVCRTVEELLGLPMEWPGYGRLPRQLILVSGLLQP